MPSLLKPLHPFIKGAILKAITNIVPRISRTVLNDLFLYIDIGLLSGLAHTNSRVLESVPW